MYCFFVLQERFDEFQLTKAKTKEATTTLEPYVAIDVDEVAVERTSTKQKTKGRMSECNATISPILTKSQKSFQKLLR